MFAITEANVSNLDRTRQPGLIQTEARRGTTILLVDDHFLIREALRGVLEDLKEDTTILEAADASQALEIIAKHKDIGFVFLELDLPDRDGLSMLGQIRERHPGISVVVLSVRRDGNSVAKALSLGASAFIPKSVEREILLSALDLVFAGGVYIPPEIFTDGEPLVSTSNLRCGAYNVIGSRPTGLDVTARQLEVLQLIMRGKTNKAICRELNIALPTIKNHVTAILKALKVTNRTEAVVAARERGWEWPFVTPSAPIGSCSR